MSSHGRAEDTHRQVQCGGREASTGEVAGGDQFIQAHLTKVTSTVTARQALVKDEPEEDDVQNAREVIAHAREHMDTSLKQIDT